MFKATQQQILNYASWTGCVLRSTSTVGSQTEGVIVTTGGLPSHLAGQILNPDNLDMAEITEGGLMRGITAEELDLLPADTNVKIVKGKTLNFMRLKSEISLNALRGFTLSVSSDVPWHDWEKYSASAKPDAMVPPPGSSVSDSALFHESPYPSLASRPPATNPVELREYIEPVETSDYIEPPGLRTAKPIHPHMLSLVNLPCGGLAFTSDESGDSWQVNGNQSRAIEIVQKFNNIELHSHEDRDNLQNLLALMTHPVDIEAQHANAVAIYAEAARYLTLADDAKAALAMDIAASGPSVAKRFKEAVTDLLKKLPDEGKSESKYPVPLNPEVVERTARSLAAAWLRLDKPTRIATMEDMRCVCEPLYVATANVLKKAEIPKAAEYNLGKVTSAMPIREPLGPNDIVPGSALLDETGDGWELIVSVGIGWMWTYRGDALHHHTYEALMLNARKILLPGSCEKVNGWKVVHAGSGVARG